MEERAEAMESVERTITELGAVFQQLAEMIASQSEKVERIDANVEQVVRCGASGLPGGGESNFFLFSSSLWRRDHGHFARGGRLVSAVPTASSPSLLLATPSLTSRA